MAIAYPLNNYKFNYPTYFTATLYADVAVGASLIYLDAVSPTATEVKLTTFLKRGDTITLTSTDTTYNGYTEQAVVEKVETATHVKVYLKEPLTYAYDSGDSVRGYGSGMPEDWIQGSGNIDRLYHTTIKPPDGGYADNYAFYSLCSQSGGGEAWIAHRDFELDHWKEYCWYRMGCMYKAYLTGSTTTLKLGAYDGLGVYRYSFKPTTSNTWAEVNFNFLSDDNLSIYLDQQQNRGVDGSGNPRLGNVSLHMAVDPAAYSYAWSTFDDVYLEHIRGIAPIGQCLTDIQVQAGGYPVYVRVSNPSDFTVGSIVSVWGLSGTTEGLIVASQGRIDSISSDSLTISGLTAGTKWASGAMIEEFNTGCWTFTEYPDVDGVSWEPVSSTSVQRTSNNGLKLFNTSGWGERPTRVQINMNFTDVSYTFYRKMLKFEEACKRGELLNLHQDTTSFDLPELKQPFFQGFMTITGFKHNIWNRELTSFQVSFLEV